MDVVVVDGRRRALDGRRRRERRHARRRRLVFGAWGRAASALVRDRTVTFTASAPFPRDRKSRRAPVPLACATPAGARSANDVNACSCGAHALCGASTAWRVGTIRIRETARARYRGGHTKSGRRSGALPISPTGRECSCSPGRRLFASPRSGSRRSGTASFRKSKPHTLKKKTRCCASSATRARRVSRAASRARAVRERRGQGGGARPRRRRRRVFSDDTDNSAAQPAGSPSG